MEFRTTIEQSGKTATGMQVPEEIVSALGSSKRPAVRVRIGKYTYRSTIAPYMGAYMIPVSAEVREAAGVAAGDEVVVDVELDTEPREIVVPPDLQQALERDLEAKKFFEGLSYSNKRRIVIPIEDAKTTETRERRIIKSVAKLSEGKI